jgi:two-component system, NtrC family, response regulator GlrR
MVLADRAVSRLHAELAPRHDGLWVRDLGSRNGTFVAGVKVHDARVPPGATIRLGTTDLVVTYDPPSPVENLYPDTSFRGLQGVSTAMRAVLTMVAEQSTSGGAVLFVGETGTGKKALARAMHEASTRSRGSFVVLDCAALSGSALAPEMIEQALAGAAGGTLVLDGPAELSLAIQRELLPPLDANVFRVVATSQVDLRVLVNQGAFREELYFRLAGATVNVPPLRERLADLPLLLQHFLGDRAELATPALLGDLARVPWTGNVRDLERYAARLRATGGEARDLSEAAEPIDDVIPAFELDYAPPASSDGQAAALAGTSGEPPHLPAELEPWFGTRFKEFRERWIDLGEREYLRRLMKRTGRSSGAASREAGLERTYLYRLLKKHGA